MINEAGWKHLAEIEELLKVNLIIYICMSIIFFYFYGVSLKQPNKYAVNAIPIYNILLNKLEILFIIT